MLPLHWVPHNDNAITIVTDISTDLETLSPIFPGVEILAKSGIVRGVFKISSNNKFQKIEFHTNIFAWFRDNNIWMYVTVLKSCSNRKLGWFINLHPTYTNFAQATNELKNCTEHVISLDLSPHRLVWPRPSKRPLITRCLKTSTSCDETHRALDAMIYGLSTYPPKYAHYSIAELKIVPFEGDASLPSSAIEHIIIRQNTYLYRYNTSVCVENIQFIDKEMDLTDVNEDPY